MPNPPFENESTLTPLRSPFRLGPWRVEPDLNQIVADSGPVPVIPRDMKVLCVLASRPGRVVLRDELLASVWPDVVVNEEVLTSAVSQLRSALGDDPARPRYIQTIRKKGYRLVAPVVSADETVPAAPPATDAGAPPPAGGSRHARWLAAVLVAALGLALVPWFVAERAGRTDLWRFQPLTSEVGDETWPALSPDGQWVAFARSGADASESQLVVRRCDGGEELQLTRGPGRVTSPAWSPDGGRIAFCRTAGDSSALYVVSALGSPATRVADLLAPARGLDWSPDGRSLACAPCDARGIAGLSLLDLESRRWSARTAPPAVRPGEAWPAFSPDGGRIAFARADSSGLDHVYVVPAGGGAERRVSRQPLSVAGLDWLPDGRRLVVAGGRGGGAQLWRLDAADGVMIPAAAGGYEMTIRPSAARRGRGLVAETVDLDRDLYRLALTGAGAEATEPVPLTALNSTRLDHRVACSPGGARLAFVSRRGGEEQVQVGAVEGGRPSAVTALEHTQILDLHWSEDERRLVFTAMRDGAPGLFALDLATGRTERLLPAEPRLWLPHLSRDGGWIYANVAVGGRWEFSRVRLRGGGRERILDSPARYLVDSRGGDTVWCAPVAGAKLFRWIRGAGKSIHAGAPVEPDRVLRAIGPGRVYALDGTSARGALWCHDLVTGDVRTLGHLDGRRCESISVSRDGRWLYLAMETRRDHDLVRDPDAR